MAEVEYSFSVKSDGEIAISALRAEMAASTSMQMYNLKNYKLHSAGYCSTSLGPTGRNTNLVRWRIQSARSTLAGLRRPTWRTGRFARAARWTRSQSMTKATTLCATCSAPWRQTCCRVRHGGSERSIDIHKALHEYSHDKVTNVAV